MTQITLSPTFVDMGYKVQHNLFALKRKLEILKARPYTWKEIADRSGVHYNTLQNYAHNNSSSVDLVVAQRLLDYFAAEGMPIGVQDLLTVERTQEAGE